MAGTRSAPVTYTKGGMRADTRKLDQAQKATDASINNLTALLDAQFGSARGSILHRGSSAWAVISPGAEGKILTAHGAGADLTWETLVTPPEWELIETRAVDGAEDFTGLANYQEIIFLFRDVAPPGGGNGHRAIRVSTDNGSTFLSSTGDYASISNGAETDTASIRFNSISDSTAKSGWVRFSNFNISGAPKFAQTTLLPHVIPTTTALNALRLFNDSGSAEHNAGTAYLYGLPAPT